MAKKLQLRGGTTSEHSSFTGAVREVTVDTDKDTLVVHDGSTAGGIPLAKASEATNKLPLAGGTLTGNLSLGDNVKAQFGAGNDLQIYHDGGHSWIQDVGTGNLRIAGTELTLANNDFSKKYIDCANGGSTNIFFDGSKKLATTSTGIDVTGTVAATSFTGDGGSLTGIDALPTQSSQSGKFLTTDGTNANWEALSSNALSTDFTVATGKTVTAGTIANLYNGEIGINPVANLLGTEEVYSAETFNYITGDGNTIVKAYSNSSGHHYMKSIRTSDMSVVSDVAVYTGYTAAGTSIKQVSGNRFIIYGKSSGQSPGTGTSGGYNVTFYTGQFYFVMCEVSSSGNITYGSAYTGSHRTANSNPINTVAIYNLNNNQRAGLYWVQLDKGISGGAWYTNYTYYYYTFPITGSLDISRQSTASILTQYDNAIMNTAGNKLVKPSTSTSWNICNWDGVDVSSGTTITTNRTNLSTAVFLKPDPTQDKILCFYINTNLEMSVETLDWTSSSINVVPNSKWIVEEDASGVSLGEIKGSANGVGISYENGSKGRFKSLSLDSNMIVTGASALMTTNVSNVVPGLAYKGSDIFQAWNNNVATYTNQITVNAYSTSPLTPLGVIKTNGSSGDSVAVQTRGVVGGFTGLTLDAKYYYDTAVFDGTVTLTNTGTYVGRAVSATQIQLTDLTEQ